MEIVYPKITKEKYLETIDKYLLKADEVYDENYQRAVERQKIVNRVSIILMVISGIAAVACGYNMLYTSYPEHDIWSIATLIASLLFVVAVTTLSAYVPAEINKYDEVYKEVIEKYEKKCPGVKDENTRKVLSTFLQKIEMFKLNYIRNVDLRIYKSDAENEFELSTEYGSPSSLCIMFEFPYIKEAIRHGVIDFSILDEKIEMPDDLSQTSENGENEK